MQEKAFRLYQFDTMLLLLSASISFFSFTYNNNNITFILKIHSYTVYCQDLDSFLLPPGFNSSEKVNTRPNHH